MPAPGADCQGGNIVALSRRVSQVGVRRVPSHGWPLLRTYIPVGLGLGVVGALILVALVAPLISPYDPSAQYSNAVWHGPGQRYFLGTDMFGRDLFSRVIWGTRISLQVGLGSVMVGFAIGVPSGLLASYVGGKTEAVIMRGTDLLLASPLLLLALIIVTALGGALINEILAIGIGLIPNFIRVARSLVLSLKTHEYVMAGLADGGGSLYIMVRHLFPNMVSTLVVVAPLKGSFMTTLTASALRQAADERAKRPDGEPVDPPPHNDETASRPNRSYAPDGVLSSSFRPAFLTPMTPADYHRSYG